MRVLFTTLPGSGHFHPLVPLARALTEHGHEVAFACVPAFCPAVERAGFRAFPAGDPGAAESVVGTILQVFNAAEPAFRERLQHARARGDEWAVWWVIGNVFGGILAARALPDLLAVGEEWRPDLVVREFFEFGGYLAAEVLGLPHATVQNTTFPPEDGRLAELRRNLDALRATQGLPPDPDGSRLYHYLCLSPMPPRYHDPAAPRPATLRAVRAPTFDRVGDDGLPAWVAGLPARPTIYATIGTEPTLGGSGQARVAAILAALRDEPVTLIVTTGGHTDPAAFGPQPAHVHLARYIPQSLLLPRCDLVISHAGWNTVLAALERGLPMVLLPSGNDQPEQASRCAALVVGRVVEGAGLTPEGVRDAVRAVLGQPRYRDNAARLRDEMAAQPDVHHAVALLERLARDKQPLLAAG